MNDVPGLRSATGSEKQSVSVLGCGWFGLPFARELVLSGYRVLGSSTSESKRPVLQEAGIEPFVLNFPEGTLSEADLDFFKSEVLFIAIPPRRKEGKSSEYLKKIKRICQYASAGGVEHVVLISSTGVFPNANRAFNELDIPVPDNEGSRALQEAEREIAGYPFSSTVIRFGGLIGEGRDPGRFFAGKTGIANGQAPVNLIWLSDCIGICKAIVDQKAFGHVYHACSPDHPSRAEFYTRSAIRSGLPAPEFNNELLNWKIIDSVNLTRVLSYSVREKLTE